VTVDQSVGQLPLRAGELKAVALDRRGSSAGAAKLLPLDHELRDAEDERLDGGAAPATPEA
jgi:hypothetical protein